MKKYLFVFLMLMLPVHYSYGQGKVEAEQKVLLRGTLKLELFYGAPGFGESPETDAKENTYILHLDKPILFRDTSLSEHEYEKTNTIHVRCCTGGVDKLRKFKNNKVEISCNLYGAITGHHHAPAVTDTIYYIKKIKN